ncbi:hypothetical protein AMECASPLE_024258 [Ameca splendens]|uniref:Uncharacterized protein n=1 Tax=Ameca splendens TaxID=208324 RepID=A0ABV0Y4D1_9TELE
MAVNPLINFDVFLVPDFSKHILTINLLNLLLPPECVLLWVKAAKTTTEHSGTSDPAEPLRRVISDFGHQIQSHDSTLCALMDQQRNTNQQLEQMASLLQHALTVEPSSTPDGSTASAVSQQLSHSRGITSTNPEKFPVRLIVVEVFSFSVHSFSIAHLSLFPMMMSKFNLFLVC